MCVCKFSVLLSNVCSVLVIIMCIHVCVCHVEHQVYDMLAITERDINLEHPQSRETHTHTHTDH